MSQTQSEWYLKMKERKIQRGIWKEPSENYKTKSESFQSLTPQVRDSSHDISVSDSITRNLQDEIRDANSEFMHMNILNELNKISDISVADAFNNALQNFGPNTRDLTFSGTKEVSNRNITWNMPFLDRLYRDSPYYINAFTARASKPLNKGIEIKSKDVTSDELSVIQEKLEDLYSPMFHTLSYMYMHGGSGALIVIDGEMNERDLQKPLIVSKLGKKSFLGLKPLNRWYQLQPNMDRLVQGDDLGEDNGIPDATALGYPLYYWVSLSYGKATNEKRLKVHRSRLLLANTQILSKVETQIEQYFGPSLAEISYADYIKYESMWAATTKTMQRDNIPHFKIGGLGRMAVTTPNFKKIFSTKMETMKLGLSSSGAVVTSDEDDFTFTNAQLQGRAELLILGRQQLSSALRSSMSEIFGTNPELDGGTELVSKTETENVRKNILSDWYKRLIPLIYKSELGKKLKSFSFKFKPLESPTTKEKAESLKLIIEMLHILWEDDAIDLVTYHQMLGDAQDNVSDILHNLNEKFKKHIEQKSTSGDFVTASKLKVEVAEALNQGKNGNGGETPESQIRGKQEGGNPKTKNKVKVEVPVEKR